MAPTRRGAPLKTLDDPSAPGEARIDIGVRIGWALRVARLTAGERSLSQVEMVRRLERVGVALSSTTAHRIETGARRMGVVVDAYERVLELHAGTLRAPIDILCRTFPYSPEDRDPGGVVGDVREMEELLTPLCRGVATGGDWLRWARGSVSAGGLGMPENVMRQIVDRCLHEMGRSWGAGYHARYEALSLLRCGPYGDVVLDSVRDLVADPHVQVLNDAMSLVGEAATPRAMAWAADLLEDPRDHVGSAAVMCLENMVSVSADATLLELVEEQVVRAYLATERGSERWRWLTHLVRLMPRPQHARVRARLDKPLAPALPPSTEPRSDVHWKHCEVLSQSVSQSVGIEPQPLLTRLLLEVGIGPYETRAVTSAMLLRGQPALAAPVADALAELADVHPDALVRSRALRRLVMLEGEVMPGRVAGWLHLDAEAPRRWIALRLAGTSGHDVPQEVLEHTAGEGGTGVRAAASYLGMRGLPLLDQWATGHPDPAVRGACCWWQAGSAVPA